jgi:hypothetical protein
MENKGKVDTFIKVAIIVFIIVLIVFVCFFIYIKMKPVNKNTGPVVILENPLKGIVLANTKDGNVNLTAVIEEGITDFNQTYINYLLNALGISTLHKSTLGYGNPKIEMVLGDEAWSSELSDYLLIQKSTIENPDLRVKMTKEEAVKALLSPDLKQYMKDDVANGKIQIEMVAGKVELYSKGYLDMYKGLTGKEPNI